MKILMTVNIVGKRVSRLSERIPSAVEMSRQSPPRRTRFSLIFVQVYPLTRNVTSRRSLRGFAGPPGRFLGRKE